MGEWTPKLGFEDDYESCVNPTKLVVAVRLPTGATELIINTDNIESKVAYYLNAYDDDLRLKANNEIEIVDYMFV